MEINLQVRLLMTVSITVHKMKIFPVYVINANKIGVDISQITKLIQTQFSLNRIQLKLKLGIYLIIMVQVVFTMLTQAGECSYK